MVGRGMAAEVEFCRRKMADGRVGVGIGAGARAVDPAARTVRVQLRSETRVVVFAQDVTVKVRWTVRSPTELGARVNEAVAVVVTVTVTVGSSTSSTSAGKGLAMARHANARRPSVLGMTMVCTGKVGH